MDAATLSSQYRTFPIKLWPLSHNTRQTLVERIKNNFTSKSIVTQKYGSLSKEDAEENAKRIEGVAFAIANQHYENEPDGVGGYAVRLYANECSKLLLEALKRGPGVKDDRELTSEKKECSKLLLEDLKKGPGVKDNRELISEQVTQFDISKDPRALIQADNILRPLKEPNNSYTKTISKDKEMGENETKQRDIQEGGDGSDEFREFEDSVSSDSDNEEITYDGDLGGDDTFREKNRSTLGDVRGVESVRNGNILGGARDDDTLGGAGDGDTPDGGAGVVGGVGDSDTLGGAGGIGGAGNNPTDSRHSWGTSVNHGEGRTNAPLSAPLESAPRPLIHSQAISLTTILPHDDFIPSLTTLPLHDGVTTSQSSTSAHIPPQIIGVVQDNITMPSHEHPSRDSLSIFVDWKVKAEHVALLEKFKEQYGDFWLERKFVDSRIMSALLDILGETLLITQKPWDSISLEDLHDVTSNVKTLCEAKFQVGSLRSYAESASLILDQKEKLAAFQARFEELDKEVEEARASLNKKFSIL